VGGGPTHGAPQAAAIVDRLSLRWGPPDALPRNTHRILETADAFLELLADVERLPEAVFDTEQLRVANAHVAVVSAGP